MGSSDLDGKLSARNKTHTSSALWRARRANTALSFLAPELEGMGRKLRPGCRRNGGAPRGGKQLPLAAPSTGTAGAGSTRGRARRGRWRGAGSPTCPSTPPPSLLHLHKAPHRVPSVLSEEKGPRPNATVGGGGVQRQRLRVLLVRLQQRLSLNTVLRNPK